MIHLTQISYDPTIKESFKTRLIDTKSILIDYTKIIKAEKEATRITKLFLDAGSDKPEIIYVTESLNFINERIKSEKSNGLLLG